MTATPKNPDPSHSPKVAEPAWRRRLLILDGILIAGLAWLLWSVYSGKQAWEDAEARDAVEQPSENLRGYRPPTGPVD